VAADAIYVVPDTVGTDNFAWTPAVPSAGGYRVYARWPALPDNATAATFTVTHDGGDTDVTVSQRQSGGQWALLGTFDLTPSSGHKVVLKTTAAGPVVADAIRLVADDVPGNVIYVHSDHLATPQKLTDATQTVVWDRVQDPFGRQAQLTSAGGHDLPLRFPGQRADAETGFSYNYMRDYDPSLGRYIQSDPIGLEGGINTYGYVGGNPLRYVDPTGEVFPLIPVLAGIAVGTGTRLGVREGIKYGVRELLRRCAMSAQCRDNARRIGRIAFGIGRDALFGRTCPPGIVMNQGPDDPPRNSPRPNTGEKENYPVYGTGTTNSPPVVGPQGAQGEYPTIDEILGKDPLAGTEAGTLDRSEEDRNLYEQIHGGGRPDPDPTPKTPLQKAINFIGGIVRALLR
jgi:RHS repeat-associated protein